jgi:hypothetical protein
MKRTLLSLALAMSAVLAVAAPISARTFGAVYVNDEVYRVFGNKANVPDGTGTDPLVTFTNSTNPDQIGVAEFAPGLIGHHGGRWAVYHATWTGSGDASTLVTSYGALLMYAQSGELQIVRDAAADFRCPVLGDPEPIS